jgi:hypothetical protein
MAFLGLLPRTVSAKESLGLTQALYSGNQEYIDRVLKLDLPDETKTRIKLFFKRYQGYEQQTPDVPPFPSLDFITKIGIRQRQRIKTIAVAIIDKPGIEASAKEFTEKVQMAYEWEGFSEPPLEEAESAEVMMLHIRRF